MIDGVKESLRGIRCHGFAVELLSSGLCNGEKP
jgi:hypothetical protein